MADNRQFSTFLVDGLLFGVEVEKVQEVIRYQEMTRVPLAPPVNRGLPAALLVKYFQKKGCEWQLREDIRAMVDYQVVNLSTAWPAMPPMDIVMIRNVLIYFSVDTKKTILGKVRKVLKPDGYFFLGAAETTFSIDDSFERAQYDRATCYRIRKT